MSSLTAARGLLAVVFFAAGSAGAAPWTVEECVAASDEGQRLQLQGALSASKLQLEICSHPSCPALVQAACTKWLDGVLTAIPSLIVVVRVDGVDQPQTRVLLDGQPWLSELSGKPQPVDPGEHRISVEAGALTSEQRLVVNLGEKNRLVLFQLLAPVVAVPTPSPAPAAQPPPVVPVLLSGISLAGGALFAGLGLSGRGSLDRLVASPCAGTHTCDPSSVASIQRMFVAADVALAVGVLSAAAAIWQWWRWATPAVSIAPTLSPQGAGLEVLGRW